MKGKFGPILEWLKDPFNLFLIILSIAANIIQMVVSLPTNVTVLFFVVSITLVALVFTTRLLLKTRRMLATLHNSMAEQYNFLYDFSKDIGNLPAPDPIIYDENHYIVELNVTHLVKGNDFGIEEIIKAKNFSQFPTDGIKLKISGGSSIDYSELQFRYTTSIGIQTVLSPVLLKEQERAKYVKVLFPQPLQPNQQFTIEFECWWPRAMRAGTDGVIFGSPVDYKHGIGELRCILQIDKPVLYIAAFGIDINTGIFELEQTQPILMQPTNPDYQSRFLWEKSKPPVSRMYLFVFTRLQ